ncbi:MAG: zinc-ribbon domain-containing protein [bacterium]|nr:zinc-ribbon domain-containing protein [bacterium]
MFCFNCGQELEDGALFCFRCGTKMPVDEAPAVIEEIAEEASEAAGEAEQEVAAAAEEIEAEIPAEPELPAEPEIAAPEVEIQAEAPAAAAGAFPEILGDSSLEAEVPATPDPFAPLEPEVAAPEVEIQAEPEIEIPAEPEVATPEVEIPEAPVIDAEPVVEAAEGNIDEAAGVAGLAAAAGEASTDIVEVPLEDVTDQAAAEEKKKKKKKTLKIVIPIIIVAVLAAVGIPTGIHMYHESQYNKAIELLQGGDHSAAETIFNDLGDYKDTGTYLDLCDAMTKMDEGDYEGALTILNGIDTSQISGTDDLITECENEIAYQVATEAYNDGHYYAAYTGFNNLGGFKDSQEMAQKCICKKPSSSVTYRNSKYPNKTCKLKINGIDSGNRDSYVKLYTSAGNLVTCVYIRGNDSVTVQIPAGDYTMKAAYGNGDWFGEKDMFGDAGSYQVLMNGSSETFTLKKNYEYELWLETSSGEGSSVGSKGVDRSNF